MSGPQIVRSRALILSFALVAATSVLVAQTPATPAPAPQTPRPVPAPAAARLPLQRIVLYKSGIGYFEHVGRVQGNQTVSIDFTSGQLDDVLKSLTTLDLDGGRVVSVGYNSEAGLERRLGTLRVPVGQHATRAELLGSLRGARLEVRGGLVPVSGRLLSVERVERRRDGAVTIVDAVSLITESGEVHTVALDPGVSVRIAEADLNQDVARYLSLLSSERNQDVRRLAIATAGTGARDLFVSYVSEVPVWKSTYRLVLPAPGTARRPLLQGWAIVDNTGEEDWTNVDLSLVAGAPQSFIQAVSQPIYVQRPIIAPPAQSLRAPQMHQSGTTAGATGVLTGTVTDSNGGAMPGATVTATDSAGQVSSATADASGRYRIAGLAPGRYVVRFSMSGFNAASRSNVGVSGGMESVIDTKLEVGAMNESVALMGSVLRNRTLDGVSSVADRVEEARVNQQVAADAAQLGDLFEYSFRERVTIRKGQSALVPIVSGEVEADRVSLWSSSYGSPRPLRAVWLTNNTSLTLDGGTMAVIDGQAFAGEGLIESVKPGARRLLSYATDLGLVVTAEAETAPVKVTQTRITRGTLVRTTEVRQRWVYVARNEDAEARTLVVEHPVRAGWTTTATIAAAETTPSWLRYRASVAPKSTATFTVDEVQPGAVVYAISDITDEQVGLFVREQSLSPAIEQALRGVLTRKAEVARLEAAVRGVQNRIATIVTDQTRVRSNMQALKGSAEERQLLQRYVRQLDEQEDQMAALRKELEALSAERAAAQAELTRFIESIGAG